MISLRYKELNPSHLREIQSKTSSNELSEALVFIIDWLEGQKAFDQKSSGTTGVPKTLQIARSLMQVSAEQTLSHLGLRKGGTALLCLSSKYIGAKMVLVRALINQMDIILIEPSSNPLKEPALRRKEISLSSMVPLQVQKIIDTEGPEAFENFQNILIGGAGVNPALDRQLSKINTTRFFHTYGMTETVSHIALREVKGLDSKAYNLLPGNTIRLTHEQTLEVSGPVTQGKWISTNDVVNPISDTQFEYIGRIDNVINSGGIKVHPEELEASLHDSMQQLGYDEFIITSTPDDSLGEKIVLLIESSSTRKEDIILQHIEKNAVLTGHIKPRQVYFLPSFIRTENGKIRRSETTGLLTSP